MGTTDLAVAQASRGRGLGHELLSWASARAAERRKTFVRLDCADDNHGLRRFYESQGFQHVRDTTVTAPGSTRVLGSSLYQRAVAL
jgi:ribosomal protein S18 acetylase RimI-like enzyme